MNLNSFLERRRVHSFLGIQIRKIGLQQFDVKADFDVLVWIKKTINSNFIQTRKLGFHFIIHFLDKFSVKVKDQVILQDFFLRIEGHLKTSSFTENSQVLQSCLACYWSCFKYEFLNFESRVQFTLRNSLTLRQDSQKSNLVANYLRYLNYFFLKFPSEKDSLENVLALV